MFNGIINYVSYVIICKYIYFSGYYCIYTIFKINFKNFLEINIGDSIIFQGLCLTLIYKYLNFLEFELFYETLRMNYNIHNLINTEKSLMVFNGINGQLIHGHININLIIKYKVIIPKIMHKLYIFCFINLKKAVLYKSSIALNGISFTVNELNYNKNRFWFSINIVNFTYYATNIRNTKLFDILNVEFDLSLIYIFINLNYKYNIK